MIDTLIPIAGIVLIAIIYLEGGFQILRHYLIDMQKETSDNQAVTSETIKQLIAYFKNKNNKLFFSNYLNLLGRYILPQYWHS